MSRDDAVLALEQPTFTPLWASKVVDWTEIDVPAYSVTGWSSVALHLRGTIGAWKALSSKHKYLRVHVSLLLL
jgi:predicted acyl esterase